MTDIEVAELNARLEAQGAGAFMRNMQQADAVMASARVAAQHLEVAAHQLGGALAGVKITSGQAAETNRALATIERSLSGSSRAALEAADALEKVKVPQSAATETDRRTGEIKRDLDGVIARAEVARMALARVNGGGSGGGGGFFAGILPGGQRAGAGAVTAGIGLAAGLAPAVLPAVVGVAAALPQMLIGLAGAFGVVKLALADVTKQAFSTQKAFDQVSQSQKGLIRDLRSLDAGLIKHLEATAQATLIPAFRRDLHNLVTPGSVGMMQSGVSAFSGAVATSTGDISKYLGGPAFTSTFGDLLRRNAGYLADFGKVFVSLTDAFLRFLDASKPFTDWLDRAIVHGAAWLDTWSKMEQQTGAFANASRAAITAFRNIGAIVESVGGFLVAFYNDLGSGAPAMSLVTGLFNELTAILAQNKQVLNDFFKGAGAAINDLIGLLHLLNPLLHGILVVLDTVAKMIGGWRVVIDAVAVAWLARFAAMKLGVTGLIAQLLLVPEAAAAAGASAAAVGTPWAITTKAAAAEVTGLRAALLGLQGMVIPITIGLSVMMLSQTARDLGDQVLKWIADNSLLMRLPGMGGIKSAIDNAAAADSLRKQTDAANAAGTHVPLSGAPGALSSKYGWNMPAATGMSFAADRAKMLGFNSDQSQMLQNMFNYEDASGAPGDYGRFAGGKFIAMKPGTPGGTPTSFGPFQMHAGGQLPAWVWAKGPAFAQQWAWSRSGINYGLQGRQKFAGLQGSAFAQALAGYQGSTNPSAEYTAIMGGAGGGGGFNPYGTPPPLTPTPGSKPNALTQVLPLRYQDALAQAAIGSGPQLAGQKYAADAQAIAYLTNEEKTRNLTAKQLLELHKEIARLTHDQTADYKVLAKAAQDAVKAQTAASERAVLGIGAGGGAATPSVLALRSQVKAVQETLADNPSSASAAINTEIQKINRVLKNDFAPADVRQAIRDNLAGIKTDISTSIKDATAAAKQALADQKAVFAQQAADLKTQFEAAWSSVQGAADAAFSAITNKTLTGMQTDLANHLKTMQVMVQASGLSFLFGGSITQTPAEQQLAKMQDAHNLEGLQQNLKDAQAAMAALSGAGTLYDAANGSYTTIPNSANSSAVLSAQRSLSDAEYQLQVFYLGKQATVERTAADLALASAQTAYSDQQNAAMTAYSAERQLLQTQMDQQVAIIVKGLEDGSIATADGLTRIVGVWEAFGVPLHDTAFSMGGQIYNGLAAGLLPVWDMLARYQAALIQAGQSKQSWQSAVGVVPGGGVGNFSPGVSAGDLAGTLFSDPFAGMTQQQITEQILAQAHAAGIPGFGVGGVVPGPVGKARLAMVHGGEEVLTPQQRRGGGQPIQLNINIGTFVGDKDAFVRDVTPPLLAALSKATRGGAAVPWVPAS